MRQMNDSVHRQFQKLELKKEKLINLLNSIPPGKYQLAPHDKSWTIGQVANHIYLTEKNSLGYIRKKLSYPDSLPKFHLKSWGGILLIKLVFLGKIKIKAPASIDMWKIDEVFPINELNEKWSSVRAELISFIEKNQPQFSHHLVFRHVFAGRMTMQQMLIFMNDHMAHHQKQINRILKQLA